MSTRNATFFVLVFSLKYANLRWFLRTATPSVPPARMHPLQTKLAVHGYMAQLDALRTFAVGGVMYYHFYQGGISRGLPLGGWGVQLFFLLSGFLITGILLNCKDAATSSGDRCRHLGSFYIRRALRIFPLFYMVNLGAAAIDIPPVRETLGWHLTYTSNFYFSQRGAWNGPVSHFWSLAVEEQFYLAWPFLILFVPDRHLIKAVVAAILLAPAFRIAGHFAGWSPITLTVMMFGSLGLLGLGGLLACYRHRRPVHYESMARRPGFIVAGILLAATVIGGTLQNPENLAAILALEVINSLAFAWLVHLASVGIGGTAGRLLETRALLYCGKISYGLYVLHPFVPWIFRGVSAKLNLPYPDTPILQFVCFSAATVAAATCSWFFFEKPVNNLKRHFEYRVGHTAQRPSESR